MIYNFDNLSFQILSVSLYKHRDEKQSVAERPYAALSYRLCGEGRFQIDGRSLTVKTGDVIFIPDGMPYEVEYSCSESIVIHLTECNYREAEVIAVEDKRGAESRFWQLLRIWQEVHSSNRAKSCVYDILSHFESERTAVASDPDVARCVQYFVERFRDAETTVEALCRDTHISHSSLQRKFKRHLGVTPKQYLVKLRMNLALELLMRGEMSVKGVAYACGYEDEKYFSRAFKQTYGYSPMRFVSGLSV